MIRLPDGRIAYDCVKLAQVQTEGIKLDDYPNHVIEVTTRNTKYTFIRKDGETIGYAMKEDGSHPRYLAEPSEVHIAGSTWGGSMLKVGYIGVGMYLEFWCGKTITTSQIQAVRVGEIEQKAAA